MFLVRIDNNPGAWKKKLSQEIIKKLIKNKQLNF